MTIKQLIEKYNEDYCRAKNEYNVYCINKKRDDKTPYNGFQIDYAYFDKELRAIIKKDFDFSDALANFIHDEAYEKYHSGFSDIFWGTYALAEFVKKAKEL